jgi:hypothetical protein
MSPIYTPGKLILRRTYIGLDDPDAAAYITAVEIADGQPLEIEVRVAIHSFVKGCKADGIWPAIKASCIMAGARTLAGALVPLVGPAPTNINFVAGDYNRKTGLVGNGSTKCLNSNRASNADPQDNRHLAVFVNSAPVVDQEYIGANNSNNQTYAFGPFGGALGMRFGSSTFYAGPPAMENMWPGVLGARRTSSTNVDVFSKGQFVQSVALTSNPPNSIPYFVFARTLNNVATPVLHSSARLAFYSIGESLDLALLDARVTALINTFGAVIP